MHPLHSHVPCHYRHSTGSSSVLAKYHQLWRTILIAPPADAQRRASGVIRASDNSIDQRVQRTSQQSSNTPKLCQTSHSMERTKNNLRRFLRLRRAFITSSCTFGFGVPGLLCLVSALLLAQYQIVLMLEQKNQEKCYGLMVQI